MPARAPSLRVSVVATPADRAGVRGLSAWLGAVAPRGARGQVTVALVTDARIRRLNRQFRAVDAATDVLSFTADPSSASPSGAVDLGDIAIARGVAARQARAAGHALSTEVRVLALHGLLHLLGYDHETDDGEMARVEARLRRKGGLPSGLIERVRRHR